MITLPLTVEFDISRHAFGSVNYARFRIYNLSKLHASLILKNWNDFGLYKRVVFQAGYGPGPLPVLFTGNASQVQSVREGNDYVTTIESFDAGFAYSASQISINVPQDTVRSDLIDQLVQSLAAYNINAGAIGNSFTDTVKRGSSFSGSPISILKELTNGQFFVDQGRANAIAIVNGEVIQTPTIPTINSASGLLGTPTREQTVLNFDTLFEPTLIVGQRVFLQSNQNFNYNQNYAITHLRHKGTISAAICGDAVTSIGVFCTNLTPIPIPVQS